MTPHPGVYEKHKFDSVVMKKKKKKKTGHEIEIEVGGRILEETGEEVEIIW